VWRQEERNIYEDYRKYFGEEPPKVGAIAIMTDTDNTGEKATAWIGPLFVSYTRPTEVFNKAAFQEVSFPGHTDGGSSLHSNLS